jgi:hypothetical protein
MNKATLQPRFSVSSVSLTVWKSFVESHSQDGTWEEIQQVIAAYPQCDTKAMRQPGKDSADAVFTAFDATRATS